MGDDGSMVKYVADLMGVNWTHDADYIVDHSHSMAEKQNIFELICFASPVEVLTRNGMERGEKGDIILHTPDFRVHHYTPKGIEEGFINDWIYLASDCMYDFIKTHEMPANTLIHTGNPLALRNSLNEINDEKVQCRPYFQEYISVIIEKMLLSIVRLVQEQNVRPSSMSIQLTMLRQQLMREYAKQWTVQEMADSLNLSCSRFSVLYRQKFGISPISDLIGIRLQAARLMLKSTSRTMREIAEDCGFQNEYYFSKVFKSHTGVSPSKYR